jgi:hypothetical protein
MGSNSMSKKQAAKTRGMGARGPIARKVIAGARQQLEKKVTNLADWREARVSAETFQETVISKEHLADYDPCHGLYIYGQNQLSVLIEQISGLPQLEKLADVYARAEEEYMPSGPPMSPLTRSYFSSWGAYDLCTGGAKKETLGTVAIDLVKYLQIDEGLITIFESMQASRMGIYMHEGSSGRFVRLRELVTGDRIKAISPGDYQGHAGELWYARVLPPPFEHDPFDYSVVFTTPYVLGKCDSQKQYMLSAEQDWLAYFDRTLKHCAADDRAGAYASLMKYGTSRNYWNEFVFLAYRNHQHDVILLEGFPDMPSSLPHSEEGK